MEIVQPSKSVRVILIMNKKQLIVMWIGIIAIVLMGLVPPWFFKPYKINTRAVDHSESFYKFITPRPLKGKLLADIDFSLLCVQWVIVAAITGGLVVTFADLRVSGKSGKGVKA